MKLIKKSIRIEDAWQLYKNKLPEAKGTHVIARRYELHIQPYFRDRTIPSITKIDIDNFIEHLGEKTTKTGLPKLSPWSIVNILELLDSLYSKMIEWGHYDGIPPTQNIRALVPDSKAKRIKTKYVGVYYREGESRLGINGKPDICYDITYKKSGKTVFEKVGWKSEGYTINDAIEVRGSRVKSLRHPDLLSVKNSIRIEDAWQLYEKTWLPTVKGSSELVRRFELYIQPYFKGRTIQSITKFDIQTFVANLLDKTVTTTKSGKLSPGSVSKILELLSSLYSKMIEWGHYTEIPPTRGIKIPDSKMKRERYLQPTEARFLLEGLSLISCNYYFIAKIGIYTGMRLDEILTMKVNNIDLTSHTISIDGKTGNRPVFISEQIIPDLRKLIEGSTAPTRLLFHEEGKPITRTAASKKFIRIFDAMGLNNDVTEKKNKLVFHSLRHTFCSWLAMQGVSLYTIGSLAGHTKPDTTQRYAKLSASVQHDALRQIQNMLES